MFYVDGGCIVIFEKDVDSGLCFVVGCGIVGCIFFGCCDLVKYGISEKYVVVGFDDISIV